MLDKKRAQTWVKVVAWILAASFGISFTVLTALPNRGGGNAVSGSGADQTTSARSKNLSPVDESKAADNSKALIGQAELALKNGELDQAVGFLRQALAQDKKNKAVKEKLAAAYYDLGRISQTKDTSKAIEAYTQYLELSPKGAHADHAAAALEKLKTN